MDRCRVKNFSHPQNIKLDERSATTWPDLDESLEFRNVSFYRTLECSKKALSHFLYIRRSYSTYSATTCSVLGRASSDSRVAQFSPWCKSGVLLKPKVARV